MVNTNQEKITANKHTIDDLNDQIIVKNNQ